MSLSVIVAVLVVAFVLVLVARRRGGPAGAPVDTGKMTLGAEGIKHEIVKEGAGPSAKRGDRVRVHYTGWLENGLKFDSSRDRREPFEFWLGRGEVIKGWDETVAQMKVGEVRRVAIPPQLGYGSRAIGDIPSNSTLVFEIELLEIKEY